MDKEGTNDDDYAIAVDEVTESELSVENEPLETTQETQAIVEEKYERAAEAVGTNTSSSDPTTKKEIKYSYSALEVKHGLHLKH